MKHGSSDLTHPNRARRCANMDQLQNYQVGGDVKTQWRPTRGAGHRQGGCGPGVSPEILRLGSPGSGAEPSETALSSTSRTRPEEGALEPPSEGRPANGPSGKFRPDRPAGEPRRKIKAKQSLGEFFDQREYGANQLYSGNTTCRSGCAGKGRRRDTVAQ